MVALKIESSVAMKIKQIQCKHEELLQGGLFHFEMLQR